MIIEATSSDTPPRTRTSRGLTLIEVLVAFAILSVSILGLVAGLIVASTSNGWAATRTQSSAFALSRLERLHAVYTGTLCSTVSTDLAANCTTLSPVMSTAPTPFNPDVAAGTGGWAMDVLDWPFPTNTNNAYGDDVMFGPVLVMGDSNAVDIAQTLALRQTMYNNWTGAAGTGCDSTLVTSNPAVLCREIHIEPADSIVPDGGTGNGAELLRVWVRVLRGGTTDWRLGTVNMDEVVSQ